MENGFHTKIELLKHTIDRYDHYYDSINNKGNLYLTLNTFLLGGIITGYYSIKDTIAGRCDIVFFVWIGVACCIASIAITLWAIIPYLNKRSDTPNGSLLSFLNVSSMSMDTFKKAFSDMSDEERYTDYLQQVYLLARGLDKKFARLKSATYLLGGCFLCIIIIGLKILK